MRFSLVDSLPSVFSRESKVVALAALRAGPESQAWGIFKKVFRFANLKHASRNRVHSRGFSLTMLMMNQMKQVTTATIIATM
jgi:hypothetical protein